MSTKSSIKWRDQTNGAPGFHLYDDVLDSIGNDDPPVYLRLDGVHANLETQPGGGVTVTVVMPREMARVLGLVPTDMTPN